MGFTEAKIVLDSPNNVYYAGQTVSGKLQFQQDKVKTFRGLYMKAKGHATVRFQSTNTRIVNGKHEAYQVHHNSDEEYFNIKNYLVGGESGEHSLHHGHHEFPFQFHIPAHCPSSFEGQYGHIRYTIKFVVDRAYKIDQEKEVSYRVIALKDLNAEPSSKEPMEFKMEDTYYCCCSGLGTCQTLIKLPVSGFCPGQRVPVEISCLNNSSVEVDEIKIKILKDVTFHAHENPAKKYSEDKVAEVKKSTISGNTVRNVTLELEIPEMDVCNLDSCRIIDVKYRLKVEQLTSGCHGDLDEEKPVILGDIPLNGLHFEMPNPNQGIMPTQNLPQVNITPAPYPNSPYPGQAITTQPGSVPSPMGPYPGQVQPGNVPSPMGPYPGQFQPGNVPSPMGPYPGQVQPGNVPSPMAPYPGQTSPGNVTSPMGPYPGQMQPYPGQQSNGASPNLPYPGRPVTPQSNVTSPMGPYPGVASPTVPYPGNSPYPVTGNGYPGQNPPSPYPRRSPSPMPMPGASTPYSPAGGTGSFPGRVSPAPFGFVADNKQKSESPANPTNRPASPYDGASAPLLPDNDPAPMRSQSPYNPEFMDKEKEKEKEIEKSKETGEKEEEK